MHSKPTHRARPFPMSHCSRWTHPGQQYRRVQQRLSDPAVSQDRECARVQALAQIDHSIHRHRVGGARFQSPVQGHPHAARRIAYDPGYLDQDRFLLGEPLRQFPFFDFGERGLIFLAYQTSIVEQFEFILKQWVNNPNFKEPRAGHDPIIGQNNAPGANRERQFTIAFTRNGVEQREVISTQVDWVIPTGGGYFFSPSIAALELFAS